MRARFLTCLAAGSLCLLGALGSPGCARSGFWLSACRGVDCGGHGVCGLSADNTPACACDPGYDNDGLLACVSILEAATDGGPDARRDGGPDGREAGSDAGADAAADSARPGPAWLDPGDTGVGSWATPLFLGSASACGISCAQGVSTSPAMGAGHGQVFVVWAFEPDSGSEQIYGRRFDGTRWIEIGAGSAGGGGISESSARIYTPAMAVGVDGWPIVAWGTDSTDDYVTKVFVRRFDGAAWVELGEGSASGYGVCLEYEWCAEPALAIDATGRPVLAYTYAYNDFGLYLKAFDGAAWVELGAGSASGSGIALTDDSEVEPSLAVDADGRLLATWSHQVGIFSNGQIYARLYDGATWSELGQGSATGSGISASSGVALAPRAGFDADQRPLVAWHDSGGGTYQVYVKVFDGTGWIELGSGSASGGGLSLTGGTDPVLLNDADGAPVLFWVSDAGGPGSAAIEARVFRGAAWEPLHEAPGGSIDGPAAVAFYGLAACAVQPGRFALSWATDALEASAQIYALAYDGGTWSSLGARVDDVGGVSDPAADAEAPRVVLDGDGQPSVAWVQHFAGGSSAIYVERFDGTAWTEVGAGSASGAGLSSSQTSASGVRLAQDDGAGLHAAWLGGEVGAREVYLARFDGTAWVEVGAGSSRGSGVTDSGGTAGSFTMALDTTGAPVVAYSARLGASSEIYLRRFDGAGWGEMGAGSTSGAGISQSAGPSSGPSLALAADGTAMVAWSEALAGTPSVYVRRFDGAAWVEMGAASASGAGIGHTVHGLATWPVARFDAASTPIVSWVSEAGGAIDLLSKRFDGAAWVEHGQGAASDGGVSLTGAAGAAFDVAPLPGAGLAVVWEDALTGGLEIYGRRLEGNAWVELSPGTASEGGISNSFGQSTAPSVAVRGQRACVAWQEQGAAVSHVVLRCATME